jgi:hypothetical protein
MPLLFALHAATLMSVIAESTAMAQVHPPDKFRHKFFLSIAPPNRIGAFAWLELRNETPSADLLDVLRAQFKREVAILWGAQGDPSGFHTQNQR